jgi:hypothetical protein
LYPLAEKRLSKSAGVSSNGESRLSSPALTEIWIAGGRALGNCMIAGRGAGATAAVRDAGAAAVARGGTGPTVAVRGRGAGTVSVMRGTDNGAAIAGRVADVSATAATERVVGVALALGSTLVLKASAYQQRFDLFTRNE